MGRLWRKYFHIPSEGNISECVFLARLALDINLIVLDLVCIAYSAYALFSTGTAVNSLPFA